MREQHPAAVTTDEGVREAFAQDASGLHLVPDAVARPTTYEEVAEVLRRATAAGTPVTPAGAAPRLTRIGAFHVDVNPRQTLIVLTNRDVPGVIGRVGTLLGDAGVNIAEYHQARLAQGGDALAVVSVDGRVGSEVKQRLCDLPDVQSATVVHFREG